MGSWGSGSFENDSALDWKNDLIDEGSVDSLLEAFKTVLENEDYIEVDDACAAVAAAEIVIAISGRSYSLLPTDLRKWLKKQKFTVNDSLKKEALLALEQVETDSELEDLWKDSEDYSEWEDTIKRLKSQLA